MCRDYIPDTLLGDEIVQSFWQQKGNCKNEVAGSNPAGGAN